jgi:hypothetical protein
VVKQYKTRKESDMTKKHFDAIAYEIKQIANMEARLLAALAICKASNKLNSNFNQDVFLTACEV